jgi:hypothetical protein
MYHVFSYPVSGYANDTGLQTWLTERSKRGERITLRLFAVAGIVFASGLIGLYFGFPFLIMAVIPCCASLPIAAIFYLRSPKANCPHCNQRMRKDWQMIKRASSRYGEFLVCDTCMKYGYTHRASRP